jgi:hypothetical protein
MLQTGFRNRRVARQDLFGFIMPRDPAFPMLLNAFFRDLSAPWRLENALFNGKAKRAIAAILEYSGDRFR